MSIPASHQHLLHDTRRIEPKIQIRNETDDLDFMVDFMEQAERIGQRLNWLAKQVNTKLAARVAKATADSLDELCRTVFE